MWNLLPQNPWDSGTGQNTTWFSTQEVTKSQTWPKIVKAFTSPVLVGVMALLGELTAISGNSVDNLLEATLKGSWMILLVIGPDSSFTAKTQRHVKY